MTSSTKSFVVVCLFALLAFACAQGPEAEEATGDCTPPPEGLWLVTHHFPAAPGEDELINQISTVMEISTTQIENVYTGSAGGVAHDSQIEIVPNGTPVMYNMIGIFDPETCTLSGVVYNFDLRIGDPIQWFYDGEMMSGPYVNADDGVPLFTTMGRHDVVPIS